MNEKKDSDWKGAIRKKFRWSTLQFEFGRMCFITDCAGRELKSWWEWEDKK